MDYYGWIMDYNYDGKFLPLAPYPSLSIIIHPYPTNLTPSRDFPDPGGPRGRVSLHFRDAEYCTVTEELSVRGVTQARRLRNMRGWKVQFIGRNSARNWDFI